MAGKHQIFSSNKATRRKANRSWRRKAKLSVNGAYKRVKNSKLGVKPVLGFKEPGEKAKQAYEKTVEQEKGVKLGDFFGGVPNAQKENAGDIAGEDFGTDD